MHILQHPQLRPFPTVHVHRRAVSHRTGYPDGHTQPAERYADTVDQYYYGRPPSPIPGRRASGPRGGDPRTTRHQATHHLARTADQRAHVCRHHHSWHAVGVQQRDVRQQDNPSRHNDDIHLFRSLRHVERSLLPITKQVHLRHRTVRQQNVPAGGLAESAGAGAGGVLPAAAEDLRHRGAHRTRSHLPSLPDVQRILC